MSRSTILGIVLVTAVSPARLDAQQQPFTLEQALSAPFPDELVAAPAGGAIAWVYNAQGARNLWIATPPEYQGRALTTYKEDEGQELGELAWTPDGRALVYVRGGASNSRGEYPNPLSLPAGVEQGLWIVAAAGSLPRRLGEGHSPAVSPKGDRVAFLKQGQVWWVPLADSAKPEQLVHARGTAQALRWSPDGAKLAFASGRGDHGFIGVYDVAAKTLRFLDPSVDRDEEPVWSPDGAQIAFIRIPAAEPTLPFTPRRAAPPWSIRVADVATGRGREVWKADAGRGSAFREIVAENQLLWGAESRLVFPWEKEGWTHLYAVPLSGGAAALLTPGAFEVEHLTLTPDGREVVFSSNQDDIDRRHVWRVSVAGGKPQAVTSGTGIEWAPAVASDGKAIAFLRADARKPPRPAILTGSGPARELATGVIPGEFPEAALVEPQQVLLSASDGVIVHGQLFLPRNLRPGERRPAVIFFHGGSRREMLLGWHYLYYYRNAYALNQYLASRGFIVLSVNYRSGIGYGLEFREALHYGAQGASEFGDVLGAGLYLRGRGDVDPKRIGLWGGSYGGFLTAMGLARASDLFAAGVDLHGVHQWNVEIRNWVPDYDPEKRADFAKLALESSPIAYVKDWRSPVLLIQGDDDRNVQFSQTVDLAAALRPLGVEVEQLVFPDEVHDFLTHAHWLAAYHAAAEFLERRLGSPRTASR
ncbi:MAG: S9 family peptidase [Gemmatimonadetes bacterium 13_1_40CM_4_69_8]|nr:MAG: S9 family peptidase [Gemmatimonadetes bacterium 13_1_40CM_69_22]OLC74694.1 MAG: S9 family peptidase [Gemmatimonadetes bacterium 13_1_40CM_4_69_8]